MNNNKIIYTEEEKRAIEEIRNELREVLEKIIQKTETDDYELINY